MANKSDTRGISRRGSPLARQPKAKARQNKRALVGYFSPEMCDAIKELSRLEATTIQALIGEGLDLVLDKRGYVTFEEK